MKRKFLRKLAILLKNLMVVSRGPTLGVLWSLLRRTIYLLVDNINFADNASQAHAGEEGPD